MASTFEKLRTNNVLHIQYLQLPTVHMTINSIIRKQHSIHLHYFVNLDNTLQSIHVPLYKQIIRTRLHINCYKKLITLIINNEFE